MMGTFIKLISYKSTTSTKTNTWLCIIITYHMSVFVHVCVSLSICLLRKAPDSRGHFRDVVDVGQSKLCLLGWVETSGAKPQPPKHPCEKQQDNQQPSEDKCLHRGSSTCIYKEKDTGGTTLCNCIVHGNLNP